MTARDETKEHIKQVASYINKCMQELALRADLHDASKLREPEVSIFDEYTKKLKGMTYGSKEYQQCLDEMKPALEHHYAQNRHHPEHNENGLNGMTLIDLLEMMCDWKAATLRHKDGSLEKSLEINAKRFGISEQLADILKNTAEWIEDED